MHKTHALSRVLVAATSAVFVFALQTYAQSYRPGISPPVAIAIADTTLPALGTSPLFPVTLREIAYAGFGTPSIQLANKNGAFSGPTQYFRVKETATTTHREWGDAGNIVAITALPVADQAWVYNHGQAQVVEMGGRTQIRASRAGLYLSVTGPDATKTATLLQYLLTR